MKGGEFLGLMRNYSVPKKAYAPWILLMHFVLNNNSQTNYLGFAVISHEELNALDIHKYCI